MIKTRKLTLAERCFKFDKFGNCLYGRFKPLSDKIIIERDIEDGKDIIYHE